MSQKELQHSPKGESKADFKIGMEPFSGVDVNIIRLDVRELLEKEITRWYEEAMQQPPSAEPQIALHLDFLGNDLLREFKKLVCTGEHHVDSNGIFKFLVLFISRQFLACAFHEHDRLLDTTRFCKQLDLLDLTFLFPLTQIEQAYKASMPQLRVGKARDISSIGLDLSTFTGSCGPYTIAEIYACFSSAARLNEIRIRADMAMLIDVGHAYYCRGRARQLQAQESICSSDHHTETFCMEVELELENINDDVCKYGLQDFDNKLMEDENCVSPESVEYEKLGVKACKHLMEIQLQEKHVQFSILEDSAESPLNAIPLPNGTFPRCYDTDWRPPSVAQWNLFRRAGAFPLAVNSAMETVLHLLCNAALELAMETNKGTTLFQDNGVDVAFSESVDWICENAPMALLSADEDGYTPLCRIVLLFHDDEDDERQVLSIGLKLFESRFFRSLSVGFEKCFSTCSTLLLHVCRHLDPFRRHIECLTSLLNMHYGVDGIPEQLQPLCKVLDWTQIAMGGSWESGAMDTGHNEISSKACISPSLHDLVSSSTRLSSISDVIEAKLDEWQAEELSMELREFESRCDMKARSYEERISKLEANIDQRAQKSQKHVEPKAATPSKVIVTNSSPSNVDLELNSNASVSGTPVADASVKPMIATAEESEISRLERRERGTDEAKSVLQSIRQNRLVDCDVEQASAEVQQGLSEIRRSLCAAVERLATDLYANQCHCLWELLQNADDNRYAPDSTPCLHLSLGRDIAGNVYLMTVNNEEGLRATDVNAICDVNASSKGSGQTGHKGIGWKSVFRISDCPHVLSYAFAFKFDIMGPLGKLAFVTPTSLTEEEYEKMPNEVRSAREAGYTVNYLPLRSPEDVGAAEIEMREIVQQHMCLIFLRRLEKITLTFLAGNQIRLAASEPVYASLCYGPSVTAAVQIAEHNAEGMEVRQCVVEYLLHRHNVHVPGGASPVELVLAFPEMASCADDTDVQVQPLFTFLPVRSVGFRFAIQGPFDLLADRGNIHQKSEVNRSLCAALPEAFAASLQAFPHLKSHAFTLLGQEALEAQWLEIRSRLVDTLKEIDCVPTEPDGKLAMPNECLLLPESTGAAELSKFLSPDCLWKYCRRRFVKATWAARWRPQVQRLGVEELGLEHWMQVLRGNCQKHESLEENAEPPCVSEDKQTILEVAALSNDMSFFRKLLAYLGDEIIDNASLLERLADVPLLPDRHQNAMSLAGGPIFEALCKDFPDAWQEPLERVGVLRVLRPELVAILDAPARSFLMHADITKPSGQDIGNLSLEWHIHVSQCIGNDDMCIGRNQQDSCGHAECTPSTSKARLAQLNRAYREASRADTIAAIWTSLAILRSEYSRGSNGFNAAFPSDFFKDLGDRGLVVPTSFSRRGLGPCRSLTSPTYLGEAVGNRLPRDVMIAITSFIYGNEPFREDSGILADIPPELWLRRPAQDNVSMEGSTDSLEWEAFFHELGMQQMQPCSKQKRNSGIFLTFDLGRRLSSGSWWASVAATPRGFAYLRHRLDSVDRVELSWLKGLRARKNVDISQLFLWGPYVKYGGRFLPYLEINEPSEELLVAFRRLGIPTELSGQGLRDCLRTLESQGECTDVGVYADIYAALHNLPEDEQARGRGVFGAVEDERIFIPPSGFVKVGDCVWVDHGRSILRWLAQMHVLQPTYGRFGSDCSEWLMGPFCRVPHHLDSLPVDRTIVALRRLFDKVDVAEMVKSVDRHQRLDGPSSPTAASLLSEVKEVALAAYRQLMRSCNKVFDDQQQDQSTIQSIARAFLAEPLILLTHPDWSKHKRLTPRQAYWDVASEISNSKAAKAALAKQFQGEDVALMRRLFVDVIGVQPVMTREDLERRTNVPIRETVATPSSFMQGFHLGDFEELAVVRTRSGIIDDDDAEGASATFDVTVDTNSRSGNSGETHQMPTQQVLTTDDASDEHGANRQAPLSMRAPNYHDVSSEITGLPPSTTPVSYHRGGDTEITEHLSSTALSSQQYADRMVQEVRDSSLDMPIPPLQELLDSLEENTPQVSADSNTAVIDGIPPLQELLDSLEEDTPLASANSNTAVTIGTDNDDDTQRLQEHIGTLGQTLSDDNHDSQTRNVVEQRSSSNSSSSTAQNPSGTNNARISNGLIVASQNADPGLPIASGERSADCSGRLAHDRDPLAGRSMSRREYEELLERLDRAEQNMASWREEIQTVSSELDVSRATRARYLEILRTCFHKEDQIEDLENCAG